MKRNNAVISNCYDFEVIKSGYGSIEQLKGDLNEWVRQYNEERPLSEKYCYGKTPLQTFVGTIHLAKEKMIGYNLSIEV